MKAIVYHKYRTPDVLEFMPTKPNFWLSLGLKETEGLFRMIIKCCKKSMPHPSMTGTGVFSVAIS